MIGNVNNKVKVQSRKVLRYIASAGQVNFKLSGVYSPSNVEVFKNGIHLLEDMDYYFDDDNLKLHVLSTLNDNIEVVIPSSFKADSDVISTLKGGDVTADVRVGVSTSVGLILTSDNNIRYKLFVENDGTLKSVIV